MAGEDLGFGISEQAISTFARQTMDITQMVITFLVVFFFFAGIGVWFYYQSTFKHKLVIRTLINGQQIIKEYKAKNYTDKKGVTWWKIKGIKNIERQLIKYPEPESINVTETGRKWVELIEFSPGEYIEINPSIKMNGIPEDIETIATEEELDYREKILEETEAGIEQDKKVNDWKREVIKAWAKRNKYDKVINTFGTTDRQHVVNNIKDAQERRKHSFMEQLPQMIAIGSLVFFAVCLLIFAPGWFEAKQPIAEQNQMIASTMQENLLILRDIKLGIQTIQVEQQELDVKVQNLEKKKT